MFNLTPQEQWLFDDVKEMFPNVSSEALREHLHRDHQELTNMILDGELEMGDEYINDHLQIKENSPPQPRRRVQQMEKENEDGARQPKQRRKAMDYEDDDEEVDMDRMPQRRQRQNPRYFEEEEEEVDMDGMPLRRQLQNARFEEEDDEEEDMDAYKRRRRTANGRGARRMQPGPLFGSPPRDDDDDDQYKPRRRTANGRGARRMQPGPLFGSPPRDDDDDDQGGWLDAPPPSEDDDEEEEEEEQGPPATAVNGGVNGSNRKGVARMLPVVVKQEAADLDDLFDPTDDEPPKAAKARRRQSRAKTPDNDYDPNFTMRPLKGGERCSAHQGKQLIAWIECDGATNIVRKKTGEVGKPHLICLNCLMIRHADGRFNRTNWEYCCPIRGCKGLIAVAKLHAVLRRHAPAFLKQVQQAYRAAHPPPDEEEEEEEREEEEGDSDGTIQAASVPSTPARRHSQHVQQHAAVTPLVKRLSQTSTPGTPRSQHAQPKDFTNQVWTPASRRKSKARAAAVEEEGEKEEDEEEELPVTEDEADELRMMTSFVDREKLKKLQAHFPETAVGWLVRHADYGLETLSAMVVGGEADPLMRERADGRGATTLIKTMLADRKQFECSVCFSDYDEHLAIQCVYLTSSRRRQTLMPGEAAEEQSAEERAREEEEEARSRKDEHKFCADCIIGHARAALEQQVIMKGGVGIKCMTPNCKRALLRAHIEQVLDMQTRAVLDPLFSSEALLAADCDDVEKCQRCMFAAVMLDTKEEQAVFECMNPACKHAHCRKCGRTWDKLHENRSCEELDPEAMRKRVEEQLTEQSMHKCPRCKKGIVKADGCNKIACPCGQLSCYVCKAAIKNYKHFKNGPSEEHLDRCPLWKDPTAEFEKRRLAALAEQIKDAADDNIREELGRLY